MREFNLTVRGHLRTGLSRRVPEESVPRLWPGGLRRRQKSPILNTKLVGGPGFEPGASRSRTLRTSVQEWPKRSVSFRKFYGSQPLRPDLKRFSDGLLHELLHGLRVSAGPPRVLPDDRGRCFWFSAESLRFHPAETAP